MLAIEAKKLTKKYNTLKGEGKYALNQLDLAVPEGAIYGLLGPNGAGKTTFMKIIMGFTRPTSGSATVLGWDIKKEMGDIRIHVGYMPESVVVPNVKGMDYLIRLARINSIHDSYWLKMRAKELLEQTDLWEHRHKKISEYSQGMLKRWLLAHALMNEPELLLLDEPTANLDPLAKISIIGIIKQAKQEKNTIFLNSHDLQSVERMATHIGLINEGRLIKTGKIGEILKKKHKKGGTLLIKNFGASKLADELRNLGYKTQVRKEGLLIHSDDHNTDEILEKLPDSLKEQAKNKIITISNGGLEQLFLENIGGEDEQ
jgi:ABC-2 type transport system ATP-binding protein